MTTTLTANVRVEVLRPKAYTPVNALTANVRVEVLRPKAYTPVNALTANVMVEVLRVVNPPVVTPSGSAGAQFLSF